MTETQFFALNGGPILPDPALALKPISLPPFKPDAGPYLKVQFVVELVGRDLIPASAAQEILSASAKAALGEPDVFVMSPGQNRWRLLWSGDTALGYDSIAFAWDMVTPRGKLSQNSAAELVRRLEVIAKGLGRRAVPLRPLDETAGAVANLEEIKKSLDIGMDAALEPAVDVFSTSAVLSAAYKLGYALKDSGLLEWRQQGWPEPLLTLFPLGSVPDFDSAKYPTLSGVGIGFSVAACPAPKEVLSRFFDTLDGLHNQLGGVARDEEGNELTPEFRAVLEKAMDAALAAFAQVGLEPGSAECLRLFEP